MRSYNQQKKLILKNANPFTYFCNICRFLHIRHCKRICMNNRIVCMWHSLNNASCRSYFHLPYIVIYLTIMYLTQRVNLVLNYSIKIC